MRPRAAKITQEEYTAREKALNRQFTTEAITEQEYNQARKDLEKLDPQDDWLFDNNEPEWMCGIEASTRMYAYEQLTKTSYDDMWQRALSPILQGGIVILGVGGMGILDIAVWWISKRIFESRDSVPLAIMATTNLSIIYLMYTGCKRANESDRQEEALVDQYKDKSMEYILREAHTKGIIKDLDIPLTM